MKSPIWYTTAAGILVAAGCGPGGPSLLFGTGGGHTTSASGTGGTGGTTMTTSSSSSGTMDGGGCAAGAACMAEFACCSGNALFECSGGNLAQTKVCDAGETCNDATKTCDCQLDMRRCAGANTAQICKADTATEKNAWVSHDCPAGCAMGACVDEKCMVGARGCDASGHSVLECKAIPEDMVTELFTVVDCIAAGFENGCVPPPSGVPVTKPEDLCVNVCNVRGVPLGAKLCSPAPSLACAVLICDSSGTSLVPDHTGCSAAGIPCAKDSDCFSCTCKAGLCFGPFAQHCPAAKGICP